MPSGYPDYQMLVPPLDVGQGGTGAVSLAADTVLLGDGLSAIKTAATSASMLATLALKGNMAITGAPPDVGLLTGWKLGLYSTNYALGVSGFTMAVLVGVGTSGWFSIFNVLPANNGSALTPDTNAVVSLGTDGSVRAGSLILSAPLPLLQGGTGRTNGLSAADIQGIVAIAKGGTGTATPSILAGYGISLSGSWPGQTVALLQPLTYAPGAGQASIAIGAQPAAPASAGIFIRVPLAGTDSPLYIENTGGTKYFYIASDLKAHLTEQLVSTLATGTAPLDVTSTTEVPNLNAGRVGGTEITNAATSGALCIGSGAGTAAWGTPDGARVYNDVDETISTATNTYLTLNSERYDNGGLHSTVSNTGRLTAQKAGLYLISAHISWAINATGYRYVTIVLNRLSILAGATHKAVDPDYDYQSLSTVYPLAANDYVEVQVRQTSGGDLAVRGAPNYSPEFAIQWLGP